MKKIATLSLLLLLGACAEMSGMAGSADNGMKACLLSEANSRYAAGTLFTNTVKATASDMVKTCMKKLALQSVGISQEQQSVAENIISNLQAMKSAQ